MKPEKCRKKVNFLKKLFYRERNKIFMEYIMKKYEKSVNFVRIFDERPYGMLKY